MNLTKNFTEKEMQCPCCGACNMDDGIQYVSGTSTTWYGSVTLKLQEA